MRVSGGAGGDVEGEKIGASSAEEGYSPFCDEHEGDGSVVVRRIRGGATGGGGGDKLLWGQLLSDHPNAHPDPNIFTDADAAANADANGDAHHRAVWRYGVWHRDGGRGA